MPNLTIYLNDELYQFVKKSPSKIVQESLRATIEKQVSKKSAQS